MAPVPVQMQKAVLAVLRAVRDAGLGRVNRTTLVKLVYLLDCYYAETHKGDTASQSGWYFYSYGPFAGDLMGAISEMAGRGEIQSHSGEHRDIEYTQYWLGEFPQGPSLSDVGVGSAQALRFASVVRKFHDDLSGLLDHIYFKTLPMKGAIPGRDIDFSVFKGMGELKPHHQVGITDQSKLMKILQLGARLEGRYVELRGNSKAMAAHRPIYDRAYVESLASMDDEANDPDIAFSARLI